ncbi:MAG: tetratricopeptide repeat protein [Proteobacteria bacterium]|nr:tetratricopeptide repeat protein [Pseudomonadota bacterium]
MKLAALVTQIALAAVLSLAACTLAAPARAAGAPAPAANARPAQSAQRNRQFQKAEALYLSGRLQQAATAFAELTRSYPDDARIWFKYGNTLTKLTNYDEAATAYEKAVTLDPSQGNAPLNLALVRLFQAQQALDAAQARFAPEAPEHAQAQTLQRQIQTLLGGPQPAAAAH